MSSGITTALFSVPLRYTHNKVEMAHENDVINTILLLTRLVKTLRPEADFSFFKK
jgi:putative aminopeptidase FrvX